MCVCASVSVSVCGESEDIHSYVFRVWQRSRAILCDMGFAAMFRILFWKLRSPDPCSPAMNSENSDAGSRGVIRFLELGYPGNIAIASIQSQHDLMPFRIAVDVSMIPTEKMSTDATFLIIVKNFSRRISVMRVTLPSGEIVRAVWLLDTDPAGLPLIQAIR